MEMDQADALVYISFSEKNMGSSLKEAVQKLVPTHST